MSNDYERDWSIGIWRLRSEDRLFAVSETGGQQVVLRLANTRWSQVAQQIGSLDLDPSGKPDAIERNLSRGFCHLHAHCRRSELETIGFR